MKTCIAILLCIGLVAVSARSKINEKVKKRAAGCIYKGQTYQQGQAWQDGCLYNCICENGATGSYKCTDRCPSYGDLPPVCALVKKPGSCCSEPQCNFQTSSGGTASGSGGTMTGSGTMTGTGTGTGTMTGGTMTGTMTGGTSGVCVDKLSNCKDYTTAVCSNHDYAQWVQTNCCAFCSGGTGGVITGGTMTGTGGTMTGTGGTMTGTGGTITGTGGTMTGGAMTGTCVDTISNCADYTAAVCTDSNYATWVSTHCRRFCNKCSGTYTGTGGTVTGTGTGGTMTGTGTGGTMTGTGGTMTGTGGTGVVTGTGGTGVVPGSGHAGGACVDNEPNCASYERSICSDAHYHDWVLQNCKLWCNKCSDTGTIILPGTGTGGTGTGTGTGTMTGGTGTMTGGTGTMTGGTGTMTGGTGTMTGTCADKVNNCAAYTKAVCTNSDYSTWVLNNCAHYCNKCGTTMTGTGTGTMTGTGTGTMTGGTGTMTGTGGTGTGTMTGGTGTMTGGTGTITGGTGTMTGGTGTMTGTCGDVATNCALLDQTSHICSDSGARVYAQQNCALTCHLCGGSTGGMTGGSTGGMTGGSTGGMTGGSTGGMTGSCSDAITNCAQYDKSICTSSDYKQWATQNCAGTCNLCSSLSGSGSMTGGTVTGTGGTISGTGTMTGTGTGTGGTMTGSSSGCVYSGHLYQQGQTWKDGCKFNCQCVDGSTGKYQCSQLCVQWQLPSACHMSPPAPGKCCQTPSCPTGFNIQYPQGYTEQ